MYVFHVSSVFPRLLWRNFLQFFGNNHGIECPTNVAFGGHLFFEAWILARLAADGNSFTGGAALGLGLTIRTRSSAFLAALGAFPLRPEQQNAAHRGGR